ncbi:MAG: HAMP domain-containing sensor histidine kinase [Rhodospirillales bacterium]
MAKDIGGSPKSKGTVDQRIKDFAHEVRSPLAVVVGYTKMIADARKRKTPLEEVEKLGAAAHASAIRIGRICERVLEEETAGEQVIRREKVDFRDIAQNMVKAFTPAANERGVALKFDIDPDFPILVSDPLLLDQVIGNLVGNAIKFTRRGGSVEMRGKLDVQARAVMLVIQDDGKGIPSHLLMRLMRGERVSTSEQDGAGKGWGRGMQIVRDLAARLNADIDIASEPGHGTVISLRLQTVSDGSD